MKNLSITTLSILMLLSPLAARTINVPADYASLQAGIDAAVDGDTVLVQDGNYTGSGNQNINLQGKAILLRSQNGPVNCIIDADGLISGANGFILQSGETTATIIEGFTITTATRGIYCKGASPTLRNLHLTGNTYGVICESGSNGLVEDLLIDGNTSVGLTIKDHSSPTVRRTTIANNQGSGLYCLNYSNPLIQDVNIHDNVSAGAGAGMTIEEYSEPLIKNVSIRNNTANSAAGVYIRAFSKPRFEKVLIAGNVATATAYTIGGGGVGMHGSEPFFINVTIADNHANEYGGGISAMISHPVIINSIIWNNASPGVPEIHSFSNSTCRIAYSNVKGGAAGVNTLYGGTYTFLENVIGADTIGHQPGFDTDYDLTANSPCIDAAAAWYELDGVLLVNQEPSEYAGAAPDLGAFEYQVIPVLIADFSCSPTQSGSAPFTVQFHDQSSADNTTIQSYQWEFGDGGSSSDASPSHNYANPGVYTVSLTISDGTISTTETKANYITVTSPVVVTEIFVGPAGSDLSGDGSIANPYLTIQKGLDQAVDGDVVTIMDGSYSGNGNVRLDCTGKSLTVRSQNGAAGCIIDAEGSDAFYLTAGESNATVIRGFSIINAGYGIMCEGASPTIEDCIIRNGASGILATINWNNGISSSPVIRHNLIINNSWEGIQVCEAGLPQIINNTIVGNQTYGILTMFVDAVVVNNIISGSEFGLVKAVEDAGSVISRHNCFWNNDLDYQGLSAGSGDLNADPLFISATDYYLQAGSPCIDAGDPQTAPDSDGSIADIGAFYYHHTPAEVRADFSADALSGEAPLLVNFRDQSSGDPTHWQWDFGDGETVAEQHPAHHYAAPGRYTVTLITGHATATDTIVKTDYIEVFEPTVQPPQTGGFVKLENVPGADDPTHYYDGAFISDQIAYVVSNHNRLYKTVDGGRTWSDVSPEMPQSFDGKGVTPRVSFINAEIGCVAFSLDDGSNDYNYDVVFGYVWCTRDGGQSWSPRFDINDDQITHLQQVTDNLVYTAGTARFGVTSTRWFKKISYHPETGQYSVQNLTPLPTSRPHVISADWLNQNVGVALGRLNVQPWNIEPFISRDGGSSWTSIRGNLPAMEGVQCGLSDNSIHILDEQTILLMYYQSIDGQYSSTLWKSTDGGTIWTKAGFDVAPAYLHAFTIDPASGVGFAVGGDSSRSCYVTQNAGYSWQLNQLPGTAASRIPYATGIAADGSSWIIGANRSIWKTTTPPLAAFSANKTSGVVPLTVQFTDESQSATGNIISWNWDFGDGGTSNAQHPEYSYTVPGWYTVTLVVSNGLLSDTLRMENYIQALTLGQAEITAVWDVPADQGGWVTVTFLKSFYDTAVPLGKVTTVTADTVEMYTVELNAGEGWIAANSMVAYGADIYEILAHTPLDSSDISAGLLSFRIIAGMQEGTFISAVVTGYSVDNLHPEVPGNLSAGLLAENVIGLTWDAPVDDDFRYFRIYRSENAVFEIAGMEPYAQTTNNSFRDEQTEPGKSYYYRLTAVDFHGNASPACAVVAAHLTELELAQSLPDKFALKANYPNPFNPSCRIPFELPRSARVVINIYDSRGTLVRSLVNDIRNQGYHSAVWDARDDAGRALPSGIYLVRMQAEDFSLNRKILLMR